MKIKRDKDENRDRGRKSVGRESNHEGVSDEKKFHNKKMLGCVTAKEGADAGSGREVNVWVKCRHSWARAGEGRYVACPRGQATATPRRGRAIATNFSIAPKPWFRRQV